MIRRRAAAPRQAGCAARGPAAGAGARCFGSRQALLFYAAFVLYPLAQSIQYSFYNWDGIGVATPAGLANWRAVFTQPELLSAIVHAFELIVFYTLLPVSATAWLRPPSSASCDRARSAPCRGRSCSSRRYSPW